MKKALSLILAVLMLLSVTLAFASCEKTDDAFKVGFIFLHDENSTYDKNFLDAANSIKELFNLSDEQFICKTNVGEDDSCTNAANDLVAQGCKIVFANSFGHEQFMLEAAKA